MKFFILLFIGIYQKFFSPVFKNILGVSRFCSFSPSCSEYARREIKKQGVIIGGKLSIKRLFECSGI